MKRPGVFGELPLTSELYQVEREVTLWRAVLDQVVEDLGTERWSAAVRDWVGTKDFYLVCHLAAVPYQSALRIIRGEDTKEH